MHRNSALSALIAATLALAASVAHAGAVGNLSATANATLTIVDSGNFSWSIDLNPLITIDYGTGNVSTNTSPAIAPGVSATKNGAEWSDGGSWAQVTDASGQAAMQWHSWTRQDGTLGTSETDTAGGTNAWRSVFTFRIGGNLDPEMAYGLSFKNNTGATQTYTYTQGETMDTPINGAYSLYSDLVGGLTNSSPGSTTLDLQPISGGAIQQLRLGNSGVATVDPGVDMGPGATVPVGTSSATYGTFSNTVLGSGSYDYWEFQTRFTLSGGKDIAVLSGYASITPVPEGNGLAFMLAGLLCTAGIVSRPRHR